MRKVEMVIVYWCDEKYQKEVFHQFNKLVEVVC